MPDGTNLKQYVPEGHHLEANFMHNISPENPLCRQVGHYM